MQNKLIILFCSMAFILNAQEIPKAKHIHSNVETTIVNVSHIQTKSVKADTKLVRNKLKNIGQTTAIYFVDLMTGPFTVPTPEKMALDKKLLSFADHKGKKHKIFLVQGDEYDGSSNKILAASSVAVNGLLYAVFQDGHVESISKSQFIKKSKQQKWSNVIINYTPKKMSTEDGEQLKKLIVQLGAQKFKERRTAKVAIKKMGPGIIEHLKPFLKHDDFETQQSVKDIIKELSTVK